MTAPSPQAAAPLTPDQDQSAQNLDAATLPVIDLAPLHDGDPAAVRRVAEALGDAARTTGFFYIKNHGVPEDLVERMFAASREFHEKPRSFKMKYWCGFTTHHRGYVPFEENGHDFPKSINLNETWDLSYEAPADHPDYLAGYRMTGPNVWPDIPGWRETVSSYYQAVFDLGLKLLDAFAQALDVDPAELRQHVNCPASQLRMLRYVPNDLPASADLVGIGKHSDFECFTILKQGGPGLQVMTADDVWTEAPPLPGCFIVNIGDIFEAWSGGRFKSTQHRVINTGRERYSFPLFFGLDYHTTVQPLPRFRTAEALEKYPPFKSGEHLMRQTVGAFRYMAEAYHHGLIPDELGVTFKNPFEREAKPREAAE